MAGHRLLVLQQAGYCTRVDDLAAVLTGAGPDVDDVIRDANGLFVVLDDQHRVAEIAQAHQRVDQPLVVALMQTDRRLVEHVEHTDEAATDLHANRMRCASPPARVPALRDSER